MQVWEYDISYIRVQDQIITAVMVFLVTVLLITFSWLLVNPKE